MPLCDFWRRAEKNETTIIKNSTFEAAETRQLESTCVPSWHVSNSLRTSSAWHESRPTRIRQRESRRMWTNDEKCSRLKDVAKNFREPCERYDKCYSFPRLLRKTPTCHQFSVFEITFLVRLKANIQCTYEANDKVSFRRRHRRASFEEKSKWMDNSFICRSAKSTVFALNMHAYISQIGNSSVVFGKHRSFQ